MQSQTQESRPCREELRRSLTDTSRVAQGLVPLAHSKQCSQRLQSWGSSRDASGKPGGEAGRDRQTCSKQTVRTHLEAPRTLPGGVGPGRSQEKGERDRGWDPGVMMKVTKQGSEYSPQENGNSEDPVLLWEKAVASSG